MSERWVIIDDPLWPEPQNPFPEDSHFGRIWRRQENARLWAKIRPWYEEIFNSRPGVFAGIFEQSPLPRTENDRQLRFDHEPRSTDWRRNL